MREVLHGRRAVLLAAVAMLTGSVVPGSVMGVTPGATIRAIPTLSGRWRPAAGCHPIRPGADAAIGSTIRTAATGTGAGEPTPWRVRRDVGTGLGQLHRRDRHAHRSYPPVGSTPRGGPVPGRSWTARSGAPSSWANGHAPVPGCGSSTWPVGARSRTIDLRSLVYGSLILDDGALVVSLVDRRTRAELGVWRIGSRMSRTGLAASSRHPTVRSRRAVPREVPLCSARGWACTPAGARPARCVSRGRSRLLDGIAALVDLDPESETDGVGLPATQVASPGAGLRPLVPVERAVLPVPLQRHARRAGCGTRSRPPPTMRPTPPGPCRPSSARPRVPPTVSSATPPASRRAVSMPSRAPAMTLTHGRCACGPRATISDGARCAGAKRRAPTGASTPNGWHSTSSVTWSGWTIRSPRDSGCRPRPR